jgi:hypothetical protein
MSAARKARHLIQLSPQTGPHQVQMYVPDASPEPKKKKRLLDAGGPADGARLDV